MHDRRRQRLKLNCNRLGLPLEDNRLRFRRNGNWLGLDVRDCGRGLGSARRVNVSSCFQSDSSAGGSAAAVGSGSGAAATGSGFGRNDDRCRLGLDVGFRRSVRFDAPAERQLLLPQ